jgi:hypothetical protein
LIDLADELGPPLRVGEVRPLGNEPPNALPQHDPGDSVLELALLVGRSVRSGDLGERRQIGRAQLGDGLQRAPEIVAAQRLELPARRGPILG